MSFDRRATLALLAGLLAAPASAQSGDNVLVNWRVRNIGNTVTDASLWNDRIYLSTDQSISFDDLVIAGSVAHSGVLDADQFYAGSATLTLPRDLQGDYYVLVTANYGGSLQETGGRTANNNGFSATPIHVTLSPVADLTVSNVSGPTQALPSETVTRALAAHAHRDGAVRRARRIRGRGGRRAAPRSPASGLPKAA